MAKAELQRSKNITFFKYLRIILVFSFFFFIVLVIYQNITNSKSVFQIKKPIKGAMSAKDSNLAMSAVFHLCYIIDKYYEKNTILITPNIRKKKNMAFNRLFYFRGRWQIFLAIRYPQPIRFRNYKWVISKNEAKLLSEKAINTEIIGNITYFVLNKTADNEIGVFVFQKKKKASVFLAPLELPAYK